MFYKTEKSKKGNIGISRVSLENALIQREQMDATANIAVIASIARVAATANIAVIASIAPNALIATDALSVPIAKITNRKNST